MHCVERLRKFQLFANLKKCEFDIERVEFLGFVISTAGGSMDQSRVNAIVEWPVPSSLRETQVFLGFANFYRRFITAYSREAAPLTALSKGSKNGKATGPFIWGASEEQAFRKLITAFKRFRIRRNTLPCHHLSCQPSAHIDLRVIPCRIRYLFCFRDWALY